MVALLLASPASGQVASSAAGSGGVGTVPAPAAPAPQVPTTQTPPASTDNPPRATRRPTLTIFEATPTAAVSASASRALVRFEVSDAARRVRVRLAFVDLAGRGTRRVNLGRRRTGVIHSARHSLPAGSYRVRITAVNPRKRRAVRATTVTVTPPAPLPVKGSGVFPVQGAHDFGGADARFGAGRQGHRHQGQDIAAVEGTPVLAPKSGVVHWRAYQAAGAGYYLVLDGDDEDFEYVFMHLRQGSVLVSKGHTVTAGQQIAQVGNTGRSFGAHLHFEIWQGAWYGGGKPIDPLPVLKSWEAAA